MLHQSLYNIGSMIILLIVVTSYFSSLIKHKKIILRQRVFSIVLLLGLITIVTDILSCIFFKAGLKLPLMIVWKLHWISFFGVFSELYYYFRMYLELDTIEKWQDIYITKKTLSLKNSFLMISILVYIATILVINPPLLNETLVFVTPKYLIIALPFVIVYTIYIVQMLMAYSKKTKHSSKKVKLVIIILNSLMTCLAIQFFIDEFAILGLAILTCILLIYFLIENMDLIMSDELKVLQKNIERSSNAKLDFLYNMSHDIRSPMNAIVELSKTLRKVDEFNEEAIRADIKSIKFSCNNLVDIVNNILDINKIASGTESLQLKEYNLNKLLADLPYVIETRIGSRPIKLEFDIDQNIASKLIGDTTKIYRVIMNILTNSVKYTEVGKIRMTIKGNIEGDIQNLHIKISDTGYGIKKEDFDKMFTKFNRLDDATDNAIEGTGLGLVITKKYVDSMGGKIWFESEYGAGTIFYIDLPQKIVDSVPLSQAVDASENKKIEVCDCNKSRVLIVDDNALNIKVTKKILEKYNIEVDTVKTGKDCIYKIKSGQQYDLILLDDVLPDIGGTEVVHVVKNIQGFDIPPVIAYTANVMNGLKEEYLNCGFDDYMPKPLDINQFDGIIKRYCLKKKTGDNN